jgi:alpha-L-fucosidase
MQTQLISLTSLKQWLMKKLLLLLIAFCPAIYLSSQTYEPSASNLKYREEFQDRKFGMFIHWGVYSVMGEGE